MQFRIRTLLWIMLAVSLLCGVLFATPSIVAVPIMCFVLYVCPAFWVNGIIYARGAWRPFFIGGLVAGIGPHLGALYLSAMTIGSVVDSGSLDDLVGSGNPWANLASAGMLWFSGPFAVAGGLIGMWVYWMCQPALKPRAGSHPLASDEYVVVSGRLTTLPAERGA
jgi:hypothetical protein